MNILGISAFYHDSAAALICDGEIIAAAQEERFTRIKHDHNFPVNAVKYCLAEGGVGKSDLDAVVFYDKPITKFARIMETYFSVAPKGLRSFMMAMPIWIRKKLWIPMEIEKSLLKCGIDMPEDIYFPEHHESHAASAFFPSPFESAAVLTVDGVGEWSTSSIGHGKGNKLEILSEMHFPHSLGLLYSAFTYFTGFRVNSGEYKLMGLAPYGESIYVDVIKDNLLDLRDDGSFRLNMDYFAYLDGLVMTNDKFAALFDGPARSAESEITKREMDIAKSIQVVTEEIVLKMARHAKEITGEKNLCMAGGVALNCVANGCIVQEKIFDNVWIQPAAGDAGGALGAALLIWHMVKDGPRDSDGLHDKVSGSYLGPDFKADDIQEYLDNKGYAYQKMPADSRGAIIAKILDDQNVVGHFAGRMEFGPRALGNRSILGDARSPQMQSIMNLKIKYRESFRPFAPSCLAEKASDFFELDAPSPYMLLVAPVKKSRCIQGQSDRDATVLKDWINEARSDVPAITHVDYSARVQTVSPDTNKPYYDIIKAFDERTGFGIIINTSFNVRGEPIVCTPEDAYRCFMRTEMDYLVLGDFLLAKTEQPEWKEEGDWRGEFVLD
ncbi:MAG: carbamoyltransferase [Kiritimatiellae bacterium]|nr:carbamoyltransferase [Kiritimatiellia bacterium]